MDMNNCAVKAEHVVIRFNMASEKIDNLKEYFIKLVKHELMFKRVSGAERCFVLK